MVEAVRLVACALLLSGVASVSAAQQPAQQCPLLPTGSQLQWQEQQQSDFIVCKATTADGRNVLSMMLGSRDPDLALSRSLRAEEGSFAGEDLYWYKLDLGGRELPGMESRRITTVKLAKKHYAQIWIDAADANELATLQQLTSNLSPGMQGIAGE